MPRAPALPCAPVVAPVPPELCCCTLAPPPALPPPVCAMVKLDAATSAAAAVVANRMRLIAGSSLFYRSGSLSAVTRQRPRASAVPRADRYENTAFAARVEITSVPWSAERQPRTRRGNEGGIACRAPLTQRRT